MPDTKRALENVHPGDVDPDLIETLLITRSEADAVLAYTMLRQVLPSRIVVMLANLREVIAELPDPPFRTGTGLDALEAAGGYEATGRSYRHMFESEHGVFGVEFVGAGTLCEGIVVHSGGSRIVLRGEESSTIDPSMLDVFFDHTILLDALLEALQILGYELEPPIYVTPDDFVTEHGVAAARKAIGDLF